MMKQVTDEELEDWVVRMCAPTLLGVKPGEHVYLLGALFGR